MGDVGYANGRKGGVLCVWWGGGGGGWGVQTRVGKGIERQAHLLNMQQPDSRLAEH